MATTPVFLPGKSYGWRSLADYSPWGHKDLALSEDRGQLSMVAEQIQRIWFLDVIKLLHQTGNPCLLIS